MPNVGVDFGEAQLARVVADDLLENRPEGLAWAAPGRPEIDEDGRRQRGLNDVGFEIVLCRVEDVCGGFHGEPLI